MYCQRVNLALVNDFLLYCLVNFTLAPVKLGRVERDLPKKKVVNIEFTMDQPTGVRINEG